MGLGKGAKAERVEKMPGRTFSRAAPGTASEKESSRLISLLEDKLYVGSLSKRLVS